MNQWNLRQRVHVENETSVGRRIADFPAGTVTPDDRGEDELLAHLASVFVDVGTADSPRLVALAERGDEIEAPAEPAAEAEPAAKRKPAPHHAAHAAHHKATDDEGER